MPRAKGGSFASVYSVRSPGLISFGGAGESDVDFYLWELPVFVILSMCAGAIGALITRITSALSAVRPASPTRKVLEAGGIAAFCVAVAVSVSAVVGECRPVAAGSDASVAVRLGCGDGEYNDLAALLLGLRDDIIVDVLSAGYHSCGASESSCVQPLDFSIASIATALVITLATMALACDLSLPAGVFMPTILWGCLLGTLFGELVRYVVTDPASKSGVPIGAYALVGATAALAGVFRGSISLVIIMLEGTGHVDYLLPLLIGVAVANLAGAGFGALLGCEGSFYDLQLAAARVPFLRHHSAPETAEDALSCPLIDRVGATVAEAMSRDPVCLNRVESVARIVWVLRTNSHNGFPVVDGTEELGLENVGRSRGDSVRKGKVVGLILRSQLMVLLARRAFVEVAPPAPASMPAARASAGGRAMRDFFNIFRRERVAASSSASDEDTGSEELFPAFSGPGVEELRTYYDTLDADMRTFHHRHSHGDRTVSVSNAALDRIGLTDSELANYKCDVGAFMKIAPLTVNERCSVWRAANYLIDVGLRHLPVVDNGNKVVGMLTRGDLCRCAGDGEE